jgi:hypothetical protein
MGASPPHKLGCEDPLVYFMQDAYHPTLGRFLLRWVAHRGFFSHWLYLEDVKKNADKENLYMNQIT